MIMSKLKLYLDDVRVPKDNSWILVKDYGEFVSTILKHGLESFDTISLDHDLGETAMAEYFNNVYPNYELNYDNIKEKTGLDCAKWLVNHYLEKPKENFTFPLVYTHSANPIGSANIMGYINNFLKNMRQPQTCIRVRIDHTINE
jgi:hypothetical protein